MTMQTRLQWTKLFLVILAGLLAVSVLLSVTSAKFYPDAHSATLMEKAATPPKEELIAVDDFIKALIGGLFVIVGFFFVRTLTGFDNSNKAQIAWIKELSNSHNDLRSDFDRLKGEHDGRVHCHIREGD